MSLKDLYGKKSNQIVTQADLDKLEKDVESTEYTEAKISDNMRFVPRITVDFNNPKTFARYGSAEKYYEDAVVNITNTYPYDGSKKEKLEWHNSATYIDNWIFENKYPRTTGYVSLNTSNAFTTPDAHTDLFIYRTFTNPQYVTIKGGPHPTPDNPTGKLAKQFPEHQGKSNILDADNSRESNLNVDPSEGVTVEFWWKKESTSETGIECLFYLTNGIAIGTTDWARLMIEHDDVSHPSSPTSGLFKTTLINDIGGAHRLDLGVSADLPSGLVITNWNHYAIVIKNNADGIKTDASLYINGKFVKMVSGNTSSSKPSSTFKLGNGLQAAIGAYIDAPYTGTYPTAPFGATRSKFDEFRFWKRARTAEEIGRHWFTQVGGGTNTDDANTDLGVYYKFNEGVINTIATNNTDAAVLDYSGRISNGTIVNYAAGVRSTSSAIDEYGVNNTEYRDPILYAHHLDIVALIDQVKLYGNMHDMQNNSAIYHTLPEWIISLDEDNDKADLKNLTQTIASYFDTLHLQIEALPRLNNSMYIQEGEKPLPFANKLLESVGFVAPEMFIDSTVLESLLDRNEERVFEEKVSNVKNMIYQNIYNNIANIYKSKGTEKAFRNLLRCFGVGDELIKINLYGDGVTFKLQDNFKDTTVRENYLDFNHKDRYQATCYQQSISGNTNSTSFIAGSSSDQLDYIPFTLEADIIFPKKMLLEHRNHTPTGFTTSSLFGMHEANSADAADLEWTTEDVCGFSVQAIKTDAEGEGDVSFRLVTSDALGGGTAITLSSPKFKDVYDNQRWNFAVRLKPDKYPVDLAAGTTDTTYTLEFYGVYDELGVVQEEFANGAVIAPADAKNALNAAKRVFACAEYQNTTGASVNKTDVKVGAIRYWLDYLDNDTIKDHARDVKNFGSKNPSKHAYLQTSANSYDILQADTLALHWNFETAAVPSGGSDSTTSDAYFSVADVSSGSLSTATGSRYDWLGNVLKKQHTGKGDFYYNSDTKSVDRNYIFTSRQQLPEIINSSDTVNILDQDDDTFTKDTRPINHFWAIEKSMYQAISDDMLNMFASIADFNNIIGNPVNRYRTENKELRLLRQMFFEKVENEPSVEKYVEFYKWLDDSVNVMLQELIPASANFSEEMRTVIEGHILERNKHLSKPPVFKNKPPTGHSSSITSTTGGFTDSPVYEIPTLGINEMLYNWENGHATVLEGENTLWWKDRAERDNSIITTGDANTDADKNTILHRATTKNAGPWTYRQFKNKDKTDYRASTYVLRNLSRPYKLSANKEFIVTDDIRPVSITNVLENSVDTDVCLVPRTCDDGTSIFHLDGNVNNFNLSSDITANSPTAIAYASGKFSNAAVFNGTSSNFKINTSNMAETDSTNSLHWDGEFTIDMWAKFDDTSSAMNLISEESQTDADPDGRFSLSHTGTGGYGPVPANSVLLLMGGSGGGNPSIFVTVPHTRAADTWYHFAVTRDSSDKIRVFVNGVGLDMNDGSTTYTTANGFPHTADINPNKNDTSSGEGYDIGGSAILSGAIPLDGSVDELRIIKGTAAWTSDFTPPTEPHFCGNCSIPLKKLGNYRLPYEIVQTAGRTNNNRWLTKAEGAIPHLIEADESIVVYGHYDFTVPDRGKSKHIFVNRFSSPGSPDTMQAGMLDVEAEEFSAYNNLNFRNLDVRLYLDKWYTKPLLWDTEGEYDWDSDLSPPKIGPTGGPRPSLHKINRNVKNVNLVDGNCGKNYDNFWVQHQIPQSGYQYSWIASSTQPQARPQGYATDYENLAPQYPTIHTDPSSPLYGRADGCSTLNAFTGSLFHFDGDLEESTFSGVTITTGSNVSFNTTTTDAFCGNRGFLELPGAVAPTSAEQATIVGGSGASSLSMTGAFTVDFWFYTDNAGSSDAAEVYGAQNIIRKGDPLTTGTDNFSIAYSGHYPIHAPFNPPDLGLFVTYPSDSMAGKYAKVTFAANQWYHVALTRDGSNDVRIFIDGTGKDWYQHPSAGTTNYGKTFSETNTWDFNGLVLGGGWQYFPPALDGGIDDLRIVKGSAAWTSNFTRPTAPHSSCATPTKEYGFPFLNKFQSWDKEAHANSYEVVRSVHNPKQGLITDPCIIRWPYGGLLGDNINDKLINSDWDKYATGDLSLNELLLHRDGPYQHPSWKQIRNLENPIVSIMRKNNIMSVLDVSQAVELQSGLMQRQARKTINYIEPAVAWNKPMYHAFNSGKSQFKDTYSNNFELLANPFLSKRLKYKKTADQMYNLLYKEYALPQDSRDFTLSELKYSEYIFPKHNFVGLQRIRSRNKYDDVSGHGIFGYDRRSTDIRTFWRDKTLDRQRTLQTTTDPLSAAKNSLKARVRNSSVWPMDYIKYTSLLSSCVNAVEEVTLGDKEFVMRGDLAWAGYEQHRGFIYESSSNITPLDAGELNGGPSEYGMDSLIEPRPTLQYIHNPNSFKAKEEGWAWKASELWVNQDDTSSSNTTNAPWTDSYDEYGLDVRLIGQNYSLTPEYKISSHMKHYIVNRSESFNSNPPRMFELPGSSVESSSTSTPHGIVAASTVRTDRFFKCFSKTDHIKFLGNVIGDHEGMTQTLTLEVDAVKKLLPYNGFYPMQRTSQLGALFYDSFVKYVQGPDTHEPYERSRMEQAALQPFFAPGILFNTIKSGIAVDWAIYQKGQKVSSSPSEAVPSRGKYASAVKSLPPLADGRNVQDRQSEILREVQQSISFSQESSAIYNTELSNSSSERDPEGTYINTELGNRIPFESLVSFKGMSQQQIFYLSPSYNLERVQTAPPPSDGSPAEGLRFPYFYWGGQDKDRLYELAMHNFLAEVPNFFLQDQKIGTPLKSFISNPKNENISVSAGETYYMDVDLYKTKNFHMVFSPHDGSTVKIFKDRTKGSPEFEGYTTHGRYFGPALRCKTQTQAMEDGFYIEDPSQAAHTPSYFYGRATARISYQAPINVSTVTIDDIVRDARVEYVNNGLDALLQQKNPDEWRDTPASKSRMSIASSLNLKGTFKNPDGSTAWVIAPKFECPVLNFNNQENMNTRTYSNGQAADSELVRVPRLSQGEAPCETENERNLYGPTSRDPRGVGMWSGYGKPPEREEGIFIELKDTPGSNNAVEESYAVSVAIKDNIYYTHDNIIKLRTPTGQFLKIKVGDPSLRGDRVDIRSNGEALEVQAAAFSIPTGDNLYTPKAAIRTRHTSAGTDSDEFRIPEYSPQGWRGTHNVEISLGKESWISDIPPVNQSPVEYAPKSTDIANAICYFINYKAKYQGHHWQATVTHARRHRLPPAGLSAYAAQMPEGFDKHGAILNIKWVGPPLDSPPNITLEGYQPNNPEVGKYKGFDYVGQRDLLVSDNGIALPFYNESGDYNIFPANPKSLRKLCGFDPQQNRKRIGEVAHNKTISEAVVMIPFMNESAAEGYAETVEVNGNHFFKISDKLMFETISAMTTSEDSDYSRSLRESSVADMIRKIKKYNLPPDYDLLKNFVERRLNPKLTAKGTFVMYIFEFEERLNKSDLADIWQGLMPRCARKATLDTEKIEHPLDVFNFFEGKPLPASDPLASNYDPTDDKNDIRWHVFKVKRKANSDYYALTPGSDNPPEHSSSMPEYSYNWPYDYFSLVEMTRIKGGVKITPKEESPSFRAEPSSGYTTRDDTAQTETAPSQTETAPSQAETAPSQNAVSTTEPTTPAVGYNMPINTDGGVNY